MTKIATVNNLNTLINYLGTSLDWPVDNDSLDELVFEYEAFELGIHDENTVKIKNIFRFRPFIAGQPWSIFYIEFATGALPIVVMRRILNSLIIRQRTGTQDLQRWNVNDLLFISNFGSASDRKISFAHFTQSADGKAMPTLKVLGWDGDDTALRLDDVERRLTTYLKYPHDDVAHWPARWQAAFTLRPREVIKTSQELSKQLARLARDIRDRLNTVMQYESDKGPFTLLMKSFQSALIHDLSAADFADMYAQTIAYGLLSTRIADPSKTSVDDFSLTLQTNPFLRELMQTFLTMGGRDSRMHVDFDELGINEVIDLLNAAQMDEVLLDFNNRNAQEDPVIHFYELFLKEYDAKKRMQRGVFYTPKPVVGYIVRSLHELLQRDFGLADGLADTTTWGDMLASGRVERLPLRDVLSGSGTEQIHPDTPFVQILDPATGTGTFLVEVIDTIHRTMLAKWSAKRPAEQKTLWNDYVERHLLPRVFGYELMMAPYAIAHLKIGLKLAETGYTFNGTQRANVYLTNALEPGHAQLALAGIIPALAHEAAAVNTVKLETRFTVVVGNPPYSGISSNNGAWISKLIESYKYVDGIHFNERKHWLNDDYVKFIRLVQNLIDKSGSGALSFINPHGFLDNPTFRGMRWNLLKTFGTFYLIDLHGNLLKKETTPDGGKDVNVFDIKQGVSINIFVCNSKLPKKILHQDIFGTRENKYTFLSKNSVSSVNFSELYPNKPNFFFIPQSEIGRISYERGMRLDILFPKNVTGIVTMGDEFAYADSKQELKERLRQLKYESYSEEQLKEKFHLGKNYAEFVLRNKDTLILDDDKYVKCTYRPFDFKYTYFDNKILWRWRVDVMKNMLAEQNIGLVYKLGNAEERSASAMVTNCIIDFRSWSRSGMQGGDYVSPLYLYPELDIKNGFNNSYSSQVPNLDMAIVRRIENLLGLRFVKAKELNSDTFAPVDILDYCYAVLHSESYKTSCVEFLRIDFPRVPYPLNAEIFWKLISLGSKLRRIHLLDESTQHPRVADYTVKGDNIVLSVMYREDIVYENNHSAGNVYINSNQYFSSVPEAVWNFHIGGYQVCEKWLKDRKGRTLNAEDIAHYQKIVVALHETIRLMAEIDVVIEEHGGWPGAFHVADASVADEPARPQFGQVTASAPKRKAAEDKDQGSFLEE